MSGVESSGGLETLVPDFVRRSYARKFGVGLLVLGLIVATVGFVAAGQMQTQLNEQTNQQYVSIAGQEASDVQSLNERFGEVAASITFSERIQSGSPEEIEAVLDARLTQAQQEVTAIRYVDYGSATVVASTAGTETGTGLDTVSDPWTEQANLQPTGEGTTNRLATGVYTASINGEETPVVTYATRVPGEGQSFIVATVRVDDFASEIRDDASASSGTGLERSDIVLLDEGGQVVSVDAADGSESAPALLSGYQSDIDGSVAGGEAGAATTTSPGAFGGLFGISDGTLVSYAPVAGTDWTVVVETPMPVAYSSGVAQLGLLSTIIGLVFLGVFGIVLGRNTAQSIEELSEKAGRMQEGYFDVDFSTNRVDSVGQLYGSFGAMRDRVREYIEETEAARQETLQINEDLERNAAQYREVMQACAAGDLTRRMAPESRNEAMEDVAVEFNEMMDEIEATVDELKEFSDEVTVSTQEVAASAGVVRDESERTAESMRDMTGDAEEQNQTLQAASQEMDDHTSEMEDIAVSSNEAAATAEQTAELGRIGREDAREAIEGMEAIEEQSAETVEEIERLESEVEQIDELIEFISDVAEQTNMLALNANIEASRAGESGEGFAVVASEIKQLASETKTAADDIEDRLERIRSQTGETVTEVRQTSTQISENAESVRGAADVLEEIAEQAQMTNTGVQRIADSVGEQTQTTQTLSETVEGAAAVSERTAQNAERVANAAETQTVALNDMSEGASTLAERANELSETLDRFRTGAPDDASDDETGAKDSVDPSDNGRTGGSDVRDVTPGPENDD